MKQTPKTFKELFVNTGIEPTTDENGNIQYNFKATMKEEPKQETLEETAERYAEYNEFLSDRPFEFKRDKVAFICGAKWQQERSYSEEDIKKAIMFGVYGVYGYEVDEEGYADKQIKRFLEKFKNK